MDQVREAERARDDDRRAHDAAMTAVGTEVARLKRGQAELTITHWTLQVHRVFSLPESLDHLQPNATTPRNTAAGTLGWRVVVCIADVPCEGL